MMVQSKIFKGIEYVQLSELPTEQQEILNNSVNKTLFIKILINGKIHHDCIQFKDYITWFESVFQSQRLVNGTHSFNHAKNVGTPSLSLKEN